MRTLRQRKNEKGVALITALVMCMALLAMVVVLATIMQHSQEESTMNLQLNEALSIADAGMNRVVATAAMTDVTIPDSDSDDWLGFVGQDPDTAGGDTRTITVQRDGEEQVIQVRSAYWAWKNGTNNDGQFLREVTKEEREDISSTEFDIYEITAASTPVGQHAFQKGVQAVIEMQKEAFPANDLTPLYIDKDPNPVWDGTLWQINGQDHTMIEQSLAVEGEGYLNGKININPGNSQDEFYFDMPDGTRVTRDTLADSDGEYTYTGNAILVHVKPKGNHNENALTLDGEDFPLYNGKTYDIYSSSMVIHVYNDQPGNGNGAMGKWWVEITASSVSFEGSTEDNTTAAEAVLKTFPAYTLWGMSDETAELYHFTIDGDPFANIEGTVTGFDGTPDIEAMAISSEGVIYMMNNSSSSKLYKILPSGIDNDEATSLEATYVGDTGLSAGSNSKKEISGMVMIDDVLYGISAEDKKIYEISTANASITQVAKLNTSDSFVVGDMAVDGSGNVYISRVVTSTSGYGGVTTTTTNTEIYKFSEFPGSSITKFCTINDSGSVQAMSAHPDGYLYLCGPSKWYKVSTSTGSYTKLSEYTNELEAIAFNYTMEDYKLNGTEDSNSGGVETYEMEESDYLAGYGVRAVSARNTYDDLLVAESQDSQISAMLEDESDVSYGEDAFQKTGIDMIALAAAFVGSLDNNRNLVVDSTRCQVVTPDALSSTDLGGPYDFKTTYVSGDASISSGVGGGVLVVDGNLSVVGDFTYYGIVIVLGDASLHGGEYETDLTDDERTYAIAMPQEGKLSVTFLGSTAALTSTSYVVVADSDGNFDESTATKLFQNKSTTQSATFDTVYPAGSKLNFFLRIEGSTWYPSSGRNDTYDHWAQACENTYLDSVTGKAYCLISQLDEYTYQFGFEDLESCSKYLDWDYDDQVLQVEIVEPDETEMGTTTTDGLHVFGSVLVQGECEIGGNTKLWWSKTAIDKAQSDLDLDWPITLTPVRKAWRLLDKGDLSELGLSAE